MPRPASSPKRKRKSPVRTAARGRVLVAFALALAILPAMIWDAEETSPAVAVAIDSSVVVFTLANVETPQTVETQSLRPGETDVATDRDESCPVERTAALSLAPFRLTEFDFPSFMTAPRSAPTMLDTMGNVFAHAGANGLDLASYVRRKILPNFAAGYRNLFKRVAVMGLPRIQDAAALAHATIVGTVSTYNPYRDGTEEGGVQTASGELYDPSAWTAAIKADLRGQFRGVRYGKLYQPTFALVESGTKQLIVKINDVGPLKPGRVLDLNERSMRHFDPLLTRGLLEDVKITLLPGEDWTPGPVGQTYAIEFADAGSPPAAPAQSAMARWRGMSPAVSADSGFKIMSGVVASSDDSRRSR
jgi:rare lipoprotein A